MRALSDSAKQLLASGNLEPFYLLEMSGDSLPETLRYTTLPYDVHHWNADSGLISIEPPSVTSIVDREVYKLSFTDPERVWQSRFDNGLFGSDVTVYLGLINTFDSPLEGFPPGAPLIGSGVGGPHTLLVYKGIVDKLTHAEGEDTIVASLECSSPMADLQLVKVFNTSAQNLRSRYPGDSAFDQVFEGDRNVDYYWGKRKDK